MQEISLAEELLASQGMCSMYLVNINVFRVLVGKPEGKRQLARPRHR